VVYGLEVDGSWAGLKSSRLSDSNSLVDPLTLRTEVSWLATVRGRIGLTMSPTLLYVTGGAAFGGVKSSWFDSGTTPFGLSVDKTKVGWVVGGGIEHAFAGKWSVRAEALYHDLGKVSAGPVSLAGSTYSTTFRHQVLTARAGLALRW
jgi:outer membrane immunogenic protein